MCVRDYVIVKFIFGGNVRLALMFSVPAVSVSTYCTVSAHEAAMMLWFPCELALAPQLEIFSVISWKVMKVIYSSVMFFLQIICSDFILTEV